MRSKGAKTNVSHQSDVTITFCHTKLNNEIMLRVSLNTFWLHIASGLFVRLLYSLLQGPHYNSEHNGHYNIRYHFLSGEYSLGFVTDQ